MTLLRNIIKFLRKGKMSIMALIIVTLLIFALLYVLLNTNMMTPENTHEAEEYVVYSALIKMDCWGFNVVIVDHTVTSFHSGSVDFGRIGENGDRAFFGIETETIDDFKNNNKRPQPLKRLFRVWARYYLFNEKELDEIFDEYDDGWHEFYSRYPFSQGYVVFSGVGFNREMNEALVYVENLRGLSSGWGQLIFMKKENGIWRINHVLAFWEF